MNILNESLLIASAPAEILVALAIIFCISAVILFALAVEAGHYPELVRWIALLNKTSTAARGEHHPGSSSHAWHAVTGGYEYDCAP